ncbi:MAG: hypothetical protein HZC40_00765 [Chloroflexi bacterium]|nr:hypothetical protein [Chloroflexota bacterium]
MAIHNALLDDASPELLAQQYNIDVALIDAIREGDDPYVALGFDELQTRRHHNGAPRRLPKHATPPSDNHLGEIAREQARLSEQVGRAIAQVDRMALAMERIASSVVSPPAAEVQHATQSNRIIEERLTRLESLSDALAQLLACFAETAQPGARALAMRVFTIWQSGALGTLLLGRIIAPRFAEQIDAWIVLSAVWPVGIVVVILAWLQTIFGGA